MSPMFELDLISITRLVQVILSLVSLGINAAIVQWFNTHDFVGSPPRYLVFLVFTSVWTMLLSVPYTTFCPRYFPKYINRWASLAFELLTTLFWFSGFVAGAVYLGTLDRCRGVMCSNARAGVAFAALIFASYGITSYFPIKFCFFDDENRGLGERNFHLGMSGAERITRVRMRRDAENNARIKAERDGEKNGAFAKLSNALKDSMGVVKVRAGNVMGEWKRKAGGEDDTPRVSEMSQRPGAHNAVAGSLGSRQYGTYSKSPSPDARNIV